MAPIRGPAAILAVLGVLLASGFTHAALARDYTAEGVLEVRPPVGATLPDGRLIQSHACPP